MGLIKIKESERETLGDQKENVISCFEMNNDIILKKKKNKTGIITKKTLIRVRPGQCAIIIQNGNIVDATEEEGNYIFDELKPPSFFCHNQEIWENSVYKHNSSEEQCVIYINIQKILNNKFGTLNPITYIDWAHLAPNGITGKMVPISLKLKSYGKFSFQIYNPYAFLNEISNAKEEYKRTDILEIIKPQVMKSFEILLTKMGTEKYKIPVLEIPNQTDIIEEILNCHSFDEPLKKMGIKIVTFYVEGITLNKKAEEYIANYEQKSDKKITLNEKKLKEELKRKSDSWICPKCGKKNKGKFCIKCGRQAIDD